jgi:hypothetical protein
LTHHRDERDDMMKLKILLAALGLSFICATAQGAIIRGQDDDIEFLLTSSLQPKTTGTFAVGDVLVSVFEFPTYTLNGTSLIPTGQEVTGISVIQIASIVGNTITFQAYTGGLNAISPVDVTNGDAGGGATIALFQNSTADFNLQIDFGTTEGQPANCLSLAQCLAEATAGTLLQVDGFAGDLDELWQAVILIGGGTDVDVVGGLSGTTLVAAFNAFQTTFFNSLGPIGFQQIGTDSLCPAGSFAADGCIAGPTLSGTVLGGLGLNAGIQADGAFARSDFDAQKILAVPEPGALLLVGLGLLGLSVTQRRRS